MGNGAGYGDLAKLGISPSKFEFESCLLSADVVENRFAGGGTLPDALAEPLIGPEKNSKRDISL